MSHSNTPATSDIDAGTDNTTTRDTCDTLARMYTGYDDDHDANTLSDFGADLSLDSDTGIAIDINNTHDDLLINGHPPQDEPDLTNVILEPIGIGPSLHDGHLGDMDGTLPVFIRIHYVQYSKVFDGYVPTNTTNSLSMTDSSRVKTMIRDQFEHYAEQHATVEVTEDTPIVWSPIQ